jgi:hypothetical protein
LNNRTQGEDSITAQLLKGGGRMLQRKIQIMMDTVWKKEQMPETWNCATICPMYKKGNKMECNNYRGISFLNVNYNIFTQLVAKYIQETLGDSQCAFCGG